MGADDGEDADVGELVRRERAGEGELHVLPVESGDDVEAAADVFEDEETVVRAVRLGVRRVEIRTDGGVVSVWYLP